MIILYNVEVLKSDLGQFSTERWTNCVHVNAMVKRYLGKII